MKVLVTGATGFIGNQVVEELLNNKVQVIATSSNKEKAQLFSWYNNVEFITYNLKNSNEKVNLFEFFNKPDAVIHLAWEGLPNYTAQFHETENLPRHQQFLNNLITNGLQNLTITGTCLEYGMQEGCLDEEMEVYPQNPYAKAKNKLMLYVKELENKFNFSFKWVRLFYMYGNGQNEKSILSQLNKALENKEATFNMSGGEQIRDYLSMDEVAKNIVKIALQNKVDGIINCCSNLPIKIIDFVKKYLETNQNKITLNLGFYPYTTYEPMVFWGDNSKLKQIQND